MNLENLTPAPWATFVTTVTAEPGYGRAFFPFKGAAERTPIAHLDCTIGKAEFECANAEFIALARNAFDVMMRRGWWPELVFKDGNNQQWKVKCLWGHFWTNDWEEERIKKGPTVRTWPDPFTALVEAEKWLVENLEKRPA